MRGEPFARRRSRTPDPRASWPDAHPDAAL